MGFFKSMTWFMLHSHAVGIFFYTHAFSSQKSTWFTAKKIWQCEPQKEGFFSTIFPTECKCSISNGDVWTVTFFFFLQQDLVSFHTILQEEEETFTGLKNSNLLEILLFFLLLSFLSKNVDSFKMIGHDSSQG